MKIIAFNTITLSAEVAYLDSESGEKHFFAAQKEQPQDQALMEIYARLQQKIKGQKPDKLAVFTGPGRFTWVRSGLTVAKTSAFCWRKKLVGVNLLTLLRNYFPQHSLLLPAGLECFYLQLLDEPCKIIKKSDLIKELQERHLGHQLAGWGWADLGQQTTALAGATQFIPTALDLANYGLALPGCDQSQVEALYIKPLHLDKAASFKSKLC